MDMPFEERRELLTVFDNGYLLAGLRRFWQEEASYWFEQLKQEALKPNPNTNLMIQYSARADESENAEIKLRKAAGL